MRKSVFLGICGLLFFTFFTNVSVLNSQEVQDAEIPKPELFIHLEKQTLQQEDKLPINVFLTNGRSYSLTDLTLRIIMPDSLSWEDNPTKEYTLGTIGSHSTLSYKLNITSSSNIKSGDYNLAFIVEYQWEVNRNKRKAFVAIEKPLKVKFFGRDSIAGIPVGLAGFIVPGLCFFLILTWMKVPWSVDLPLEGKLIYSILPSIGILFLGNLIQVFDFSQTISIDLLGKFAFCGTVIGIFFAIIDKKCRYIIRQCKQRREAKLEINSSDKISEILKKLIHLNDKRTSKYSQVIVQLKDGHRYIGALGAEQNDKYFLVGWFEVYSSINPTSTEKKLLSRIKSNIKSGNLLRAIRLIEQQNNLNIRSYQSILEVPKDYQGVPMSTGDKYLEWNLEDVDQYNIKRSENKLSLLTLDKLNYSFKSTSVIESITSFINNCVSQMRNNKSKPPRVRNDMSEN